MPRARIMGAGLAGATRKGDGANVNQVQFGNKLQGLPPTTGKSTNFNLRAINNRAFGNQRNVVFCVNQLGGVGGIRGSRMFLPNADGVKDCIPGPYHNENFTHGTSTSGLGLITEPEPEPEVEPVQIIFQHLQSIITNNYAEGWLRIQFNRMISYDGQSSFVSCLTSFLLIVI